MDNSALANSIDSLDDYNEIMAQIDELMSKGSRNVTKYELDEIRRLALMAQEYELDKYFR